MLLSLFLFFIYFFFWIYKAIWASIGLNNVDFPWLEDCPNLFLPFVQEDYCVVESWTKKKLYLDWVQRFFGCTQW
jgi:hypothetical protein